MLPHESSPYGITTIFAYSDPVIRKAIWLLKYRGGTAVIKPLARAMHDRIIEELSDTNELLLNGEQKILLVPVPLSKERQKERGFNQAEVIAKAILGYDLGNSFELENSVLIKTRHTKSQVETRNKTDRLHNLKGAFTINNPEKIKDRIIILLDDVTTTGATIEECSRVLKRAKPRKIIKLALAH
ncbi:MAG: ComF family protein [Candidatus Vogelbacteria bacterium]|nr:ComF family protein [Candidatus Vogelbacteria bacterium]